MLLIIEARIAGGGDTVDGAVTLAVVERRDCSLSILGLTLAEGRALLAQAQRALVSQQVAGWMSSQTNCRLCSAALSHKDSRTLVMRTVYGKVAVKSPRLWSCSCQAAPGTPRRSVSPLCRALPKRVTPELEYLQVEWAAHLPFRQATALLKEVLPLDKGISFSGTRHRVHAVARQLDAQVERDIADQPKAVVEAPLRESVNVASVSVDSAWLNHHSSPKVRQAARARAQLLSPWSPPPSQERHVNIVAGRATFSGRSPRVYAYVHKEVPSAAARLDQFLYRSGVGHDERVTVISD